MKKKKLVFTLTSLGALPYLGFPDFEAYAMSLSINGLNDWNKIISTKEGPDPKLISATIADLPE